MKKIKIKVGSMEFIAKLETVLAPQTCRSFLKLLPFRKKLIQARWSGESAWIPLGLIDLDVGNENQISNPAPGELLFYPGGISEMEILFPYGQTIFACKAGPLSGNHFLTLIQGNEQLSELERLVLWEGAQSVSFELFEQQ